MSYGASPQAGSNGAPALVNCLRGFALTVARGAVFETGRIARSLASYRCCTFAAVVWWVQTGHFSTAEGPLDFAYTGALGDTALPP